jgi:hypothetical protein
MGKRRSWNGPVPVQRQSVCGSQMTAATIQVRDPIWCPGVFDPTQGMDCQGLMQKLGCCITFHLTTIYPTSIVTCVAGMKMGG